jgi:threonylcarbamoyladenosine tRNA methylthiotransferase MtaB
MSEPSTSGYLVKTLGCKANLADSQALELKLRAHGLHAASLDAGEAPGLVVVNSCSVTDEADRQSRRFARRLKRQYPGAKVVFTGCAAEVDPESIAKEPGIDAVIGNQDKERFTELLNEVATSGGVLGRVSTYREMASRHPMDREWPSVDSSFSHALLETSRTRAFLKIQDGCNAFCTYCIIPYGRGPARSLSMDTVISEISRLVEAGIREVVLTGINLGDYGVDWNGTYQLPVLIRRILEETRLERLRVSSLDPTEVTSELLALMSEFSRFCPHFHVSLQSPHPRILKLMKRKYGWAEVEGTLQAIHAVRSPGALGAPFVGMDVITGFPGETDEDAQWTVEALKRLPWSRLHVFPYSERKGTPATKLPGKVPAAVRAERAARLRALSLDRLQGDYLERQERLVASGGVLRGVLLESRVKGPDQTFEWRSGYTPDYHRVWVKSLELEENQVIDCMPTGTWVDRASGEVTYLATPRSPC